MEDTEAAKKAPQTGSFEVFKNGQKIEGTVIEGKYYINGEPVKKEEYEAIKKEASNLDSKPQQTVTPASVSPSTSVTPAPVKSVGMEVAKTSTENVDMTRQAATTPPISTPIISNNVSSNNTTKYVPSKPLPRPEYSGSALDRYTNRIAVY